MIIKYDGLSLEIEILRRSTTGTYWEKGVPCEWVVNEAYDIEEDRYLDTDELNSLEEDYCLDMKVQELEADYFGDRDE